MPGLQGGAGAVSTGGVSSMKSPPQPQTSPTLQQLGWHGGTPEATAPCIGVQGPLGKKVLLLGFGLGEQGETPA